MKTIALMLALLSMGATAHAQVYKWVDKDGKTQFSDMPPPGGAKPMTPAPAPRSPGSGASAGADSVRPPGKPEGTQGSFSPEEEVALQVVCGVYLLQTLTCQLGLRRYCTFNELVNGIPGEPGKGLIDPRGDANYDYRLETGADDFSISSVPKRPGLAGFYSSKDSRTRYNLNGRAGKDDKTMSGGTSCHKVLK